MSLEISQFRKLEPVQTLCCIFQITLLCSNFQEKKLYLNISDASELSSARLSSDSARAGGFSARLGSAREIFEPARLAFGLYEPKLTL